MEFKLPTIVDKAMDRPCDAVIFEKFDKSELHPVEGLEPVIGAEK